jgi:PAS domain S-box-containing protein
MMAVMTDRFSISLVETIFDSLGDIVYCVKNTERQYQSVNQAFAERVNVLDKAEMIGKRAENFFPASLAKVYEQQDRLVFRNGHPIQDQLERITHRDGTMGWFLANKFPIHAEDGQIIGLVGISQDLHTPSDSDLELANLKSIVDYIKANLDQPLRSEHLAEKISLSQIQLDRRMKRVFRLSTKKFIIKCRLEEATRRLVSTRDPLAEIALACGFCDQSAFTRQFRAAENIPPLMYRKQHATSVGHRGQSQS